ncbi:MAG: type II secretory pathway component PulF, partial [Planctomycetota bacterium]
MGNWTYKAKDKQGKTVKGNLTAPDRSEALAELQKKDLIVLEIESGKGKAKAKKGAGGGFTIGKVRPKASRVELVIFTRQLSTMVGAGIS